MRRVLAIGLVVVLTAAACGGDSGGEDEGSGQSNTTEASGNGGNESPPTTTGSPPDTRDEDDGSEGSGPSIATLTLNGETYHFSSEGAIVAQCLPDLFGIMSVQLPMVDENGEQVDGGISIVALHEGTDPSEVGQINSVHVTVGDVDWVADPEDVRVAGNADVEGKSQVDSIEVDGSTVRGTASFVGSQSIFDANSDMATGTFEATCGEERTS